MSRNDKEGMSKRREKMIRLNRFGNTLTYDGAMERLSRTFRSRTEITLSTSTSRLPTTLKWQSTSILSQWQM
jgi:hypothetical protein